MRNLRRKHRHLWGVVTLLAGLASWLLRRNHTAVELNDLRLFASYTADLLLVYAPDRSLLFVNSAVEARTGYRLAAATSATLELFHPDDRATIQAALDTTFTGSHGGQNEVRVITSTGALMWVVAMWAPLHTRTGRLRGVFLLLRDITAEKNTAAQIDQLQARLHQREKLATLGHLLTGLAHDLNTPLTSVLLSTDLLLRDKQKLPEAVQHDLNVVAAQAAHASQIVKQLLTFARKRTPQRQLIDLNTVVKQSMNLRAYALQRQGITVDLYLAPDLPSIQADPFQLQQGLLNVLANAEQAFQDERWLKCTALHNPARLSIRTACQRLASSGEVQVVVQVSDNGPGLPAELREQVFEPFVTTKPEGQGTGLGLAIVAEIVRSHDGQIAIIGSEQGGTSIEMSFPVSETQDQARLESRSVSPIPQAARAHGAANSSRASCGSSLNL
ncbi:MAG: ATP-binding protein [Chloroflexales bacterium]|nr:ATP-binding protein [Chloroflexales bacterium]